MTTTMTRSEVLEYLRTNLGFDGKIELSEVFDKVKRKKGKYGFTVKLGDYNKVRGYTALSRLVWISSNDKIINRISEAGAVLAYIECNIIVKK